MLRDLDAARRLLHGHEPERCAVGYDDATAEAQYATVCSACGTDESRERWPCRHVRLVALPFLDRRGYRQEWRP